MVSKRHISVNSYRVRTFLLALGLITVLALEAIAVGANDELPSVTDDLNFER